MKLCLLFSLFYFAVICTEACTTILVTKGASADASLIVSHSDDNDMGDQRIVYVPAKDYKLPRKRPVYGDSFAYPRFVSSRAAAYNLKGMPKTVPLGYIDEVAHTYAYIDGNYGIINEHQLICGECTNNAKMMSIPDQNTIFQSAELSRIALERCTKARDAVKLIGGLIDQYGFFGGGETLLFADTEEGWVMEMTPSPEDKGGLWVAKKIPDGEVFVAANHFRIHDIEENNPDFMCSKNIEKIAEEYGFWNASMGKFDWAAAFSPGEYNHPYSSLRRIWTVFRYVNPEIKLSPAIDSPFSREYPFSIKPSKKLSVQDLIKIHRDHYEGTEFDLTKGVAAGPFGSPTRCYGDYDITSKPNKPQAKLKGAWERSICVNYTGYVQISQARSFLPDTIGAVTWIGVGVPHATCFMPFYPGSAGIPDALQYVSPSNFDRSSAWWTFMFTANWMELRYSCMIKDVSEKQQQIESKLFADQAAVEKEANALYKQSPEKAARYLADYSGTVMKRTLDEWWKFSEMLIVKYNSGYINLPETGGKAGYSQEWLDRAGYSKGPVSYKNKAK